MRHVRQTVDGELVEGAERLLRVLPLQVPVPRGQHQQTPTRRPLHRGGEATRAYTRLHAATEGPRASRLRETGNEARQRAAEVERRIQAIQQKVDRLDEAFLYERQRDRLREELTLAQMASSCSSRTDCASTENDWFEPS